MRILIVDDDKFVCMSLKTILQADPQISVAGMGLSGAEAIRLYERLRPDIVLMDIQMAEMSGLDAGAEILKSDPDARILYLTTFSDEEYIVRALRMGACGYLIKQEIETIAPALFAVMKGQTVFGREIGSKLSGLIRRESSFLPENYGLSQREGQVIRLVAEGLNNKEIADTLFLSEGTVRNYLSAILDKLSLRDRTQLAVFYYQREKGRASGKKG